MNLRSWLFTLSTLGLAAALSAGPAHAQAPAPPDGVEVLARGPVHEAYAEPVDPRPQATPVIPKQPPEPIEELPPDQRPEGNVQWIAGYWSWDDDRGDFVWVSGFWRAPPPGRQWVPGHWQQVAGGWQWVPGYWGAVENTEVVYVPPPPDPVDAGPSVPAPGPGYVYQPGAWVYRETRYVWQPGLWVVGRPDWVWVPPHYVWTPVGYVFVPGYWDYPLRQRGLLFAPVVLERRLWLGPRFVFTPVYVVSDDFLLGALFVRPAWGHYYFGDYFEPRYRGLGFTSWVDFRIGRRAYDPLFSFYVTSHAADPAWERDLRALYVGRARGDIAPPPRTLVQQTTVIRNLTVNKNVTNVRNVTVLAPLQQVDPHVVRLQAVPHEERLREQRAAAQFREAAQQRHAAEARLLEKGPPPSRPTDPPRRVKLELPKPAPAQRTAPPPPPPVHADVKPEHRQPAPPPAAVHKETAPPPPPPKREVTPPSPPPQPRKEPPPPPPAASKPAPPPPGKDAPPKKGGDSKPPDHHKDK